MIKRRRYRYLLLIPLVAAIPASSRAAQGDPPNFNVAQGVVFDSNMFRLPDGVEPSAAATGVANPPRSETYLTTHAGFNIDRSYSRQRVRADFGFTHYAHDAYTYLDSNGISGAAIWDWAVGDRWKGTLIYDRLQTPSSDVIRTGFQSAYRLDQSYTATADYWWHPTWSAGAGLVKASSNYNNATNPFSDYDAGVVDAHLMYRSRRGSQVRVLARKTDGNHSNGSSLPQTGVPALSYVQMDYEADTTWVVDPHSSVVGRVGYSRFEYEGITPGLQNFEGPTGRLAYDWMLTDKTTVSVVLRRDIAPELLYYANAAVVATSAASLGASLAISPRISVQGVAEVRRQLTRETGAFNTPFGDADSTQFTLTGTWTPERHLSFSVILGHETRAADNSVLPPYDDNTFSANLVFLFRLPGVLRRG